MNNDQKNSKKPEAKSGSVIAIITALVVLAGMTGSAAAVVLIIAAVVIGIAAFKGSKQEDNTADGQQPQAQREFTPPTRSEAPKLDGAPLKSLSKRLTEKMQDDLTRCDDDHEHIEPDFAADPSEKRASQLKEMLRNGIIEKDEYNILMRKYGLK